MAGVYTLQHRPKRASGGDPAGIDRLRIVAVDSVLVVAVPPCKAGMITERICGCFRLLRKLAQEICVSFRVIAAGHQKVLADQKPKSVAFVVEMLLLKQAAAPDAEHVDVRRCRHFQRRVICFGLSADGNGSHGTQFAPVQNTLTPLTTGVKQEKAVFSSYSWPLGVACSAWQR